MDQNREEGRVSALDFDIVREAFRKSVKETNLAEEHWPKHIKLLFQDLLDHEPDESIINRIIGRDTTQP